MSQASKPPQTPDPALLADTRIAHASIRLTPTQAAFIQAQRVARLATSDASGRQSVVPVCYAYDEKRFQRLYTPLDEKPKRVSDRALQRLRNIQAQPEVALLIDRYEDNWSQLGYLLIHASADILMPDDPTHAEERSSALALLRARYTQYRAMALEERPLIALSPQRISAWGPALTAPTTPGDAGATDERSASIENIWLQPGRGIDFLPLARGRRSVRAYQDRPVPRAALDDILEAAIWAPSPHGRQPWRFVVITGAEHKERLALAMGDDWQATLAQDGQDAATIALRLAKSRERIRTAPALILACLYLSDLDHYPDANRQHAEEVMAIQSLGAAIQNMLLAAYSLGLDGGWMCAPLFSPATAREALGLADALIPHALITLGYAARDPKRRPHRQPSELAIFL